MFTDPVLKAVVGGLNRVLYRRILRGERAELLALVPDLVAWFTSYFPTPASMRTERRRDKPADTCLSCPPRGVERPGPSRRIRA